MLLCVTVRHLFQSKQLTTILHRLSHSESYDFGLQLETAIAKAQDQVSTFLTHEIVTGDGNVYPTWIKQLQTCTTAILLTVRGREELWCRKSNLDGKTPRTEHCLSLISHTNVAWKLTRLNPPPLYFTRIGPKFPADSSFTHPVNSLQEYYIWLFSRYIDSSGLQPVRGLGGFISATGHPPARKSTVDYFTRIHQPITDNCVVSELSAQRKPQSKWARNGF